MPTVCLAFRERVSADRRGSGTHTDKTIVPFYFAAPRKGGGRVQGGEADKTRQRTSPTLFLITVLGMVSYAFRTASYYGQWIIAAIVGKMEDPSATSWYSYINDSIDAPILKAGDSIPVYYPDVIIAYKTRPPPADQEKLDAWHIEAEKVSTVKKEVFIVRNPTLDMLRDMTSFTGLLESYRPTNTAITVHSIIPMLEFIGKLSLIALMLRELSLNQIEMGLDGSVSQYDGSSSADMDDEMEEGEAAEFPKVLVGEGHVHPLFRSKRAISSYPWGPAENILETQPSGIFCPFELSYSAPDPTGIARFIQTFPWIFVDTVDSEADSTDIERYMQLWATELCNTLAGHHLAHMMASLMAAYNGGGYCFFLQLPERHYEGCIIVKQAGEMTIRGPGIQGVSSVDFATLKAELDDFGFHTVILRKILDIVGATAVETGSVTSMRHLREIVFSGTGMPEGTKRNQISRLLPKLSFPEKVLGVNENGIDLVLQLLAKPDMAIPRSLFLATSSFFVEESERTRLVLAAWGDEPPTFNYGGTPLMACSIKGQGVGSNVKDYATTPPRVLQMRRVNMQAAVTGWNTLMSRGYIWGIYDRKFDRARGFNGPEKTRVWNNLAKWVSLSVVPKGEAMNIDTLAGGSGQKRKADETQVGQQAQKKKKSIF